MILTQPYNFRGLKWVDQKATIQGIQRYIITEYSYLQGKQLLNLLPFDGEYTLQPVVLYGTSAVEKEIPVFGHPLVDPDNRWIALDLRQVVKTDPQTQEVSVRNDAEYQMAVQRFILSGIWATGKYPVVYGYKFPHLVYGEFVSTALARKFGLHAGDQARLKALACVYYASLFQDGELTDDELNKLRIRLKNELYVEEVLNDAFELKSLMTGLDGFGQACYEMTQNVRLKGLDYNGLVAVFATSWFGLNAKEVMLTALEHPPTWCALVFASLTERSYKNSALAKAVEQKNKRDAGKEFLDELGYYTKTYQAN